LNVPLAIDFAKSAVQRQIMEIVYAQLLFGRPFVVAPEVPIERVAALQTAFMAALKDPELLAEAKRMNLDINPMPGPDVKATVERLFATPPEVLAATSKALRAP
jgi:tripartite-type tricarboxylate transporter receptor subunit TctC